MKTTKTLNEFVFFDGKQILRRQNFEDFPMLAKITSN